MKKEVKGHKDKNINQEDTLSDEELGNDEYGFEYDFFITKNGKSIDEKLSEIKPKIRKKDKNKEDQSKTFFLPDFFTHDD